MKFDAVLIAGPTATGKSAAALALAEKIGGVVITVAIGYALQYRARKRARAEPVDLAEEKAGDAQRK